jgi:hypothetical protein
VRSVQDGAAGVGRVVDDDGARVLVDQGFQVEQVDLGARCPDEFVK